MKKIMEGAHAVAEVVKLCDPKVIASYPITPQTHIVEKLAKLVANKELKAKYIEVESEFSALSSCIGATATGVRSYTATSSQGLLLMHELLFVASGLRIPLVMTVANRAVSAPLNIWNDHQDAISQRDTGWIQFYVESVQEAVDTTIQAYKIAEETSLPVMVNMDGYYLTHVYEPVVIPEKKEVDSFLPKIKPKQILDPENPMTIGMYATPEHYMKIRDELNQAMNNSAENIKKVHDDFAGKFGRGYGNGFIEEYKNDKDTVIVSMGSLCSTLKEIIDKKNNFGLVRLRTFRPFPRNELKMALGDKNTVIVIDRNISLGLNSGALFSELRDALYSLEKRPKIVGFVAGLGGKDINENDIGKMVDSGKKMNDGEVEWFS